MRSVAATPSIQAVEDEPDDTRRAFARSFVGITTRRVAVVDAPRSVDGQIDAMRRTTFGVTARFP
jgi:hypothetical protein